MLHCRLLSAPLVAGFLVAGAAFAHAGEPRAVVELFTSQGCSSCPPADKLLGELANDPSLVALSMPIDYWDYLGWKDTLASPANSARQRAYARARGDRQVYTPQIVVNGATHVLGSDRSAVERAVSVTERNAAVMSTPVSISFSGNALNVKVAAGKEHLGGEVWLCPLERSVPVDIGHGENRGRTVTYHNVVRRWLKLGDFAGVDAAWSVPLAEILDDNVDGAVAMVQQGSHDKPGIMLGAAYAPVARQTSEVRGVGGQ